MREGRGEGAAFSPPDPADRQPHRGHQGTGLAGFTNYYKKNPANLKPASVCRFLGLWPGWPGWPGYFSRRATRMFCYA